jgi:energy-coupling factor transporter ATP-binding protein EcfA2
MNINETKIQLYEPTYGGNFPLANYFLLEYNTIPKVLEFKDCFSEQIIEKLKSLKFLELIHEHDSHSFSGKKARYSKVELVFQSNEINPNTHNRRSFLLHISHHNEEDPCRAIVLYKDKEDIEPLIKILEDFVTNKKLKEIGLIVKDEFGLTLKDFELTAGEDFNIKENYNEDFIEIDKKITKHLSTTNKKGLILLHGEPGTGKTTYIKHLADKIEKQIIFVPPMMAGAISDPGFIPFLMKHPDSILIIEDAETAIKDRNITGNASSVSNILNLTDGILGECLKIQIVATFNTERTQIDKALLRKGRLISEYKFENLNVNKTNKLLKRIGIKKKVDKPLSLADIYHYNDTNTDKNNKPGIGFLVNRK